MQGRVIFLLAGQENGGNYVNSIDIAITLLMVSFIFKIMILKWLVNDSVKCF